MNALDHMELTIENEVRSTPTFVIWVNGERVDSVVGAQIEPLTESINNAMDLYH